MKKNDRIRLNGNRLNRLTYRFFIYVGMMALMSLLLGTVSVDAGTRIFYIVVLLALLVGMLILWIRSSEQRHLDRSHQLAFEVTQLYPDASSADQNRLYHLRRQRELRLEALFYLVLAVLTAVWDLGLYAAQATAFSQVLTVLVILPGLAMLSLVLLILSFTRQQKYEEMPLLTAQELQWMRAAAQLRSRPAAGENRIRALTGEKEVLTTDEYLRRERKSALGSFFLMRFAFIFFCGCPLVLLLFGIAFAASGEQPWFLLFTGVLALLSIPLWVYMTRISHNESAHTWLLRYIRLKSGKYHASRDSILSAEWLESEGCAELDLSQAGTVRYPCSQEYYQKFCLESGKEALVLTLDGRVDSVALLPEGGEATASAAGKADTDLPLSEEAIRQAALTEIENMAPGRRQAIEADIKATLDMTDYMRERGYSNMTTEEQGRMHTVFANDLRNSTTDISLSSIEDYLTKRLQVTREEIGLMKKNPFAAAVRRRLLLALVIEIVGVVGTAAAAKITGANLNFMYLIVSAVMGGLALSCAEQFISMRRFRKLQKAYRDPKYRRQLLDAEIYRELKERLTAQREKSL